MRGGLFVAYSWAQSCIAKKTTKDDQLRRDREHQRRVSWLTNFRKFKTAPSPRSWNRGLSITQNSTVKAERTSCLMYELIGTTLSTPSCMKEKLLFRSLSVWAHVYQARNYSRDRNKTIFYQKYLVTNMQNTGEVSNIGLKLTPLSEAHYPRTNHSLVGLLSKGN